MIYWTFAFLWIFALLSALSVFVISAAAAIWYNNQHEAHLPVTRGFYWAFRYHLGSLAFGALVVAILNMLRILMTYLAKKATYAGGNKCVMVFVKYCLYYVNFLKRVVEYVNKNAYVQIALSGASFCEACKQAILNVLSNSIRFMALGSLGIIITVLGYIAVVGGNSFLAYLDIKHFNYV